jgi:hypothetical protein
VDWGYTAALWGIGICDVALLVSIVMFARKYRGDAFWERATSPLFLVLITLCGTLIPAGFFHGINSWWPLVGIVLILVAFVAYPKSRPYLWPFRRRKA